MAQRFAGRFQVRGGEFVLEARTMILRDDDIAFEGMP